MKVYIERRIAIRTLALAFAVLIFAMALTSCSRAWSATSIDFRNDLIPLFTKHGCNAGACHGAAIGRGGFKLSLYGGDPGADYDAIVRQVQGRRVNLAEPTRSLLILKPAEHLEHGGGLVFDFDGESAHLLETWIRQGASDQSERQLKRFEIIPSKHIASSLGEQVPLRGIAYFEDGSKRDVTQWTTFKPEDSFAVEMKDAEVEGHQVANILRRGRHIVVARYLNEVVPVELIMPISDLKNNFSAELGNSFIDDEILESLATLGLSPSPLTDDATFLRRAYLDLTGRLPTKTQVEAYNNSLADPDEPVQANAKKKHRDRLIDALVGSEEFTEYWTLELAKLLRIRPHQGDSQGVNAYHQWLAEQVREDISYQQVARALIMATGDTHESGPANFYRTVAGPREQAEFVSELFIGSRLRCANCHNHPLDRWTQDDYHGLAAIFAKVERGKIISDKPTGKIIHPQTLEPALERIPGEFFLDENATDGRRQFANWLTDESNPYFSKAIVNRLWKQMMGRGLVEPVDDFRDTNPATHPALLSKLAKDFADNGYSLRHTLKKIATSNAYSRSANATEQNRDDDRFYSHAFRRPLEPEVLADAISDLLAVPDQYGDAPLGTRAVALVDPGAPSRSLDILGRCGRAESCENSPGAVSELSQKLHLLNGDLLNARIAVEGSRLRDRLNSGVQAIEIIDEFYVLALCRHPTSPEIEHWKQQIRLADNNQAFLEDFVWGLLTSSEFVTNH